MLTRQWARAGLLLVGLFLLLILIDGVRVAVVERQDLDRAKASLESSLALLKKGPGASPNEISTARSQAHSAASDARNALKTLDQDPVAGVAGRLPWVGDQVAAIRAGATMAARAGDALDRTSQLLEDLNARRGPDSSLLDAVGSLYLARRSDVDAVIDDLSAVAASRSGVDLNRLLPPIADRFRKIDSKLEPLIQATPDLQDLKKAAPSLFGTNNPSHYLLLLADNAELRPSGGFIGSYGVVGFDSGHFTKPNVQDVYLLEDQYYTDPNFLPGGPYYQAPPSPLADLLGNHPLLMRDACWDPNWTNDAKQAKALYELEAHQSVDGVVQIDPTAQSFLLDVTGPITVPGYGDTIDSSNLVLSTLQHTRLGQTPPTVNRKAFLGALADAFLQKLTSLPSDRWPDLAKAATRAITERHVFAYSTDPAAEALVARHSLTGDVPAPSGDGIMTVYANLGVNKADYWLTRTTTLRIDPGTGRHHLAIHLVNDSPGTPGGRYLTYIRYYLPATATLQGSLGLSTGPDDLGTDHGWRVFGGYIYVAQGGGTLDLGLDYTVPPAKGQFAFGLVKQNGATEQFFQLRLQNAAASDPASAQRDGNDLVWSTKLLSDQTLSSQPAAQNR